MRFIYKKVQVAIEKKCKKIPIESICLPKRNIYGNVSQTVCRGDLQVPWCATSLFKMLCADTNFLPKLRKCCHEEMVDNCYKSPVALHLQLTAKKVMTFFAVKTKKFFIFLQISTISDYITLFPEIVARRSGNLQIMPLAINRNRLA